MAIQGSEPTGSDTGFAAAGSTSPAAAAHQTTAHSDRPFSLLTLGNVGGIVRSATSEQLAKGMEAVQATVKESRISPQLAVAAVQIDNQQETRLKLSSIVMVLRHQTTNKVAHHTLLLEGSSDPIGSKIENINGVQVQIDRFAAQVYDTIYADAVNNTIKAAYPQSEIINTGATVVPRSFDWTDKTACRELVHNAMLAAATYLEARTEGFIDMDLTKLVQPREAQLQAQIAWDCPQTHDFTGQPVRSDIQIVASATAVQRTESASLNSSVDSKTISRVTGYLDLTWAPSQDTQQMFAPQGPGATRKYRPRFVITRLENELRMTPAAQLFAIASALCLGEGHTWFRGFAPRKNALKDRRDARDVGAVNIEANLYNDASGFGVPVDTQSATFSDRELGALINATMHPQIVFSIDVSDAGADTWYNRVFAQASVGDVNANKEILKAANTLTGGAFGTAYGNNTFLPMLVTDERVVLGYYTNKDGHRADLRDVDYLAVANILGVNNPQAISDWSQSIENTDMPQQLRLQGRKSTIRTIASDAIFTQYATRATFNPQFLQMLVQSIQTCGLGFKLVSTGLGGDYMAQRAGGMFNAAGFGMGNTGIFNAGFGGAIAPMFQRPVQPQSMF